MLITKIVRRHLTSTWLIVTSEFLDSFHGREFLILESGFQNGINFSGLL